MHLCYIDESGNGQTLDPAVPDAPPVLIVGGFTVDRAHVKSLTWDFLEVKKAFRPQLRRVPHLSDVIRTEVKGADVRRDLRVDGRNRRRAVLRLIESLLDILERYDSRVLARVWVKEEDRAIDETGVYSSSIRLRRCTRLPWRRDSDGPCTRTGCSHTSTGTSPPWNRD